MEQVSTLLKPFAVLVGSPKHFKTYGADFYLLLSSKFGRLDTIEVLYLVFGETIVSVTALQDVVDVLIELLGYGLKQVFDLIGKNLVLGSSSNSRIGIA